MKLAARSVVVISSVFIAARMFGQPQGDLIAAPKPATNSVGGALISSAPLAAKATNVMTTNSDLVGFDKLSGFPMLMTEALEYCTNHSEIADATINKMIPKTIHDLNGKKVSIEGYIIPLSYADDKVTEFLVARDPMGCCYGAPPEIHQFVRVKVKPPGINSTDYYVIRAHGVLKVGADRSRGGGLGSIYRMDADTAGPAPQ
jgi:hypothetical protein